MNKAKLEKIEAQEDRFKNMFNTISLEMLRKILEAGLALAHVATSNSGMVPDMVDDIINKRFSGELCTSLLPVDGNVLLWKGSYDQVAILFKMTAENVTIFPTPFAGEYNGLKMFKQDAQVNNKDPKYCWTIATKEDPVGYKARIHAWRNLQVSPADLIIDATSFKEKRTFSDISIIPQVEDIIGIMVIEGKEKNDFGDFTVDLNDKKAEAFGLQQQLEEYGFKVPVIIKRLNGKYIELENAREKIAESTELSMQINFSR